MQLGFVLFASVAQGLDYSTQSRLQEELRALRDEVNAWSRLLQVPCPLSLSFAAHAHLSGRGNQQHKCNSICSSEGGGGGLCAPVDCNAARK